MKIFSSSKNFITHKLILIAFLLKFYLSINLPNRWSFTQLTCNYSDGCIKRALVGNILNYLRIDYLSGENIYRLLSFLSWTILFIALYFSFSSFVKNLESYTFKKYLIKNKRDKLQFSFRLRTVFSILLISSSSLTFLIHFSGYLDHYIALLLITSLQIYEKHLSRISRKNQSLIIISYCFLIIFISTLIHELTLVAFAPTFLLAIITTYSSLKKVNYSNVLMYIIFISFISLLILSFFLQIYSFLIKLDGQSITYWINNHANLHSIMDPRNDYFTDTSSTFKSILKTWRMFLFGGWKKITYSLIQCISFISILFYAKSSLILGNKSSMRITNSTSSTYLYFLPFSIVCISSPILMSFLGWDFYRWGAIIFFNFLIIVSSKFVSQELFISIEYYQLLVSKLISFTYPYSYFSLIKKISKLIFIVFALLFLSSKPLLFDKKKPFLVYDLLSPKIVKSRIYYSNRVINCAFVPTRQCITVLSEKKKLSK